MANTSLTVTFVTSVAEAEGTESLQVELDSEMNGGATTFNYGTKAYFRIYKSPSTLTLTVTPSDGAVALEGTGTAEKTEQIIFANEQTGTTQFPIASTVETVWLGTSLGTATGAGNTVTASKSGIAVLNYTYNANFTRYSITVPAKEDYDEYAVLLYILGTAAA